MKDRRAHQKVYRAKRSAAFKAVGLRSDGKPLAPVKPCGCVFGSCLKCVKRGNKRILMAKVVQQMYADYLTGLSLAAVGRKYPQANGKPRSHGDVGDLFERRGLKLRPCKMPRLGFGVRIPEPTEKEIRALIAGLDRLRVPAEIKSVWKRWSLAQRRTFIKKLRVKFPSNRPTGPFSAGVVPFAYGDPAAHAIVDRLNVGRTSQTKVAALKPGSEGVIYGGELFFWINNKTRGDGYQRGGKVANRLFLHRILWQKFNRREIPAKHTVIHLDGNKNNFAPKNLGLRSMADCARINAWHRHPEKFPGLAKRIAHKSWLGRGKKMNAVSRAQIGALLDDSATGLFEQITRSKL